MTDYELLINLKEKLKNNFDIKYIEIQCPKSKITLILSDSMCDFKFINENYIKGPREGFNEPFL